MWQKYFFCLQRISVGFLEYCSNDETRISFGFVKKLGDNESRACCSSNVSNQFWAFLLSKLTISLKRISRTSFGKSHSWDWNKQGLKVLSVWIEVSAERKNPEEKNISAGKNSWTGQILMNFISKVPVLIPNMWFSNDLRDSRDISFRKMVSLLKKYFQNRFTYRMFESSFLQTENYGSRRLSCISIWPKLAGGKKIFFFVA